MSACFLQTKDDVLYSSPVGNIKILPMPLWIRPKDKNEWREGHILVLKKIIRKTLKKVDEKKLLRQVYIFIYIVYEVG